MRLLLVEDDESLGTGIRDALERGGYLVEWVRDGAYGLEALRSGSFDLAVL
ncbi:MAG: DNA-binding response regulator, partial [Proteobacteria bacterium]|nr:DNA-binding response regulator [Pseudomonadota bacterium]